MYEDRKQTFSIKDIVLQLLFIILLVFILIWLFPTKGYLEKKLDGIENGFSEKLKPLYTRLFTDNILTMKDAAKSYFTTPRLPQNVGDKVTMTLQEMYDKALLLELVDSNGNACDANKSYIELTKADDEYELKVTLSCSDKEAYVIEYLGCYDYCKGTICAKKTTEVVPTSTRYRYQYVLYTGGSCSGFGSWGEWTTNRIEENSNTKVQTKVEKVFDHYEQVYDVIDTKYHEVEYIDNVAYGYSTKTTKRTTTYNYTTETTTTNTSYATKEYDKVAVYDYIYENKLVSSAWVDAGRTESTYALTSSDNVRYILIDTRKGLDCSDACLEVNYYVYRVEKMQNKYETTKSCPAGTVDNGAGCIVATKTTEKYCAQGVDNGSGCTITNVKKYCAKGTDTGSGCAVVETIKENFCAAGGHENDTKTGCVIPVKKTKTVAELVYGYVNGDAVYKDVTYYRSATRSCTSARVDYKWSESANDASLKAQGYTLTGASERI